MRKNIYKCLLTSTLLLSAQGMLAQDCNIPMSVIVDEGFAHVTDRKSVV